MTVLLNGMQVSIEGLVDCSFSKLQELLLVIIGLLNEQAAVAGQMRNQQTGDKAEIDKNLADLGAKLSCHQAAFGNRLEALEKKVTGGPDGAGLEQRFAALEGQINGDEGGFEQRFSNVENQVASNGEKTASLDERMTALEDQAGTMTALASQLEQLGDKLRKQNSKLQQPQQAAGSEELSRWHQLRAQVASLQNGLDSFKNKIRPLEERLSALDGMNPPPDGTENDDTEGSGGRGTRPGSAWPTRKARGASINEDGSEIDPATAGSEVDPATAGSEVDPGTAGLHDGGQDALYTPASECGFSASTAPPSCRGHSGARRSMNGVADTAGTGGTEPETARSDAQQERFLAALRQELDAAKSDSATALACNRKLEDRMLELERSLIEGIRELKNKPLRRLDSSLRALERTVHTDVEPTLKALNDREAATKAKLAADIKDVRLLVQAIEAAGAAGTSRCLSCFQLRQQEQDPIVLGDDGKIYKMRSGTPSEVFTDNSWALSSQRPTSAAVGNPRRSSSRQNARTVRCSKTTESLPTSGRAATPTL